MAVTAAQGEACPIFCLPTLNESSMSYDFAINTVTTSEQSKLNQDREVRDDELNAITGGRFLRLSKQLETDCKPWPERADAHPAFKPPCRALTEYRAD
jgi:hypothetical protein